MLRMLPHERQVPETALRTHAPGQSMAEDAKARHPVEAIQRNLPLTEFQAKVQNRAMLFGPASAMNLQMDRVMLSNVARMPCLESDRVGLETTLGKDEVLEFVDILGDPALAGIEVTKRTVAEINEAGGLGRF